MVLSFHRDCLPSSGVALPSVRSRKRRLTVAWLWTPQPSPFRLPGAGEDSKAVVFNILGRLRARDRVPGAGSRPGRPPSLRSSLPRIRRQVPEAFLKACCLWTARVVNCLWRPLGGLLSAQALGSAWALSGVGPEGGQEAYGPRPRHARLSQGPLLPCVSSHFLTPQGLSLANESCPLRTWLPGQSSSRKRGPHPGTKPRSQDWLPAVRRKCVAPRREGPGSWDLRARTSR